MKTVCSFLLVVFSLIPLLPSRSVAQADSLHIHFRLQGAVIYWSFETTIQTSQGPVTGSFHSGNLTTDLDATFSVPRSSNVCLNCGSPNGLSFTIDTATKSITGLTVKYQQNDYSGNGITVTNYQIQFAALPYTQQGSAINAGGGSCKGSMVASVMYESSTPNGTEVGTWNSSPSPTDSLGLTVTTVLGLADVTAMSPSQDRLIAVSTDLASNSLKITIPEGNGEQLLELVDIMGRNVMRIALPPNTSEFRIPLARLLPGFCFAHIGNQVAKFVVPPR